MKRTLLALALAFAATGVLASGARAADAEPVEAHPTGCPKADQEEDKAATTETGSNATRPGAAAPVRPRTTTGTRGPRWHSLLPGMIR